jgi:hypothetical protein
MADVHAMFNVLFLIPGVLHSTRLSGPQKRRKRSSKYLVGEVFGQHCFFCLIGLLVPVKANLLSMAFRLVIR